MSEFRGIAIDLGAESGRVIVGRLAKGRMVSEEVHRFPNVPVRLPDGLYWDVLRIQGEIGAGLGRAAHATEGVVDGIGVDTWGVDFGLIDAAGRLVCNPMHYRDERSTRGMAEVERRLARAEIYATTGIQFMPINTINQLGALIGDSLIDTADAMLLMPDLLNYWLCGRRAAERTFASTTQLYDVARRDWAWSLADRLELPRRLFQELVDPGTVLGPLSGYLANESGLAETPVVAVASHDTASAVAAVPAEDEHIAYISSGTWSLVGVELPQPVLSEAARDSNFTNEEGFGPTTRLLKNVMGLWILQECRRAWGGRGRSYSYEELVDLASRAAPFRRFIDPDHGSFLAPGDMPARIEDFLARTGQPGATSEGELVRCVFESLALKCRHVVERAGALSGRSIERIHVVGGGARNEVLNQMIADATGRRVVAGPTEATALGNLLVQAFATGHLGSLVEMRAVAAASSEMSTSQPAVERADWERAADRFERLLSEQPVTGH